VARCHDHADWPLHADDQADTDGEVTMMDLQTIHAMSREAGRAARRNHNQPITFTEDQLRRAKEGDISAIRGIPNLGTFLPKGWSRVSLAMDHVGNSRGIYMGDNEGKGAFFVDKGFSGSHDEPALALDEFIERLKPGLGYAIVEEGQFQVKVGAFALRTDGRKRRAA